MKRLITICAAVLMVFAMNSVASATLWEIKDAGLQDTTNFATEWGGTLNSRSDITGKDPGTQFNITFTGDVNSWQKIGIGDGFDLPSNNSGIVAATGNSGDLSAYDSYVMTIRNPNTSGWFMANIFVNSGWTDSPWSMTNQYVENTWTWIGPGSQATLTLDLTTLGLTDGTYISPAEDRRKWITNIGLQIGTNMGSGDYKMPSCTAFNVDIIPEPATIALLGLGALSLLRGKRRA